MTNLNSYEGYISLYYQYFYLSPQLINILNSIEIKPIFIMGFWFLLISWKNTRILYGSIYTFLAINTYSDKNKFCGIFLYLYKKIKSFTSILPVHPKGYKPILSTPFVRSDLSDFAAAFALAALTVTMNNIETQINFIDTDPNLSADDKLAGLQEARRKLDEILRDGTRAANKDISWVNNGSYMHTPDFHDKYFESQAYYNSPEYEQSKQLVKSLKDKIIALHKQGVTNEESFKASQDNSPILRKVKSDFPDAWKQADYRWRTIYSNKTPKFPVDVD